MYVLVGATPYQFHVFMNDNACLRNAVKIVKRIDRVFCMVSSVSFTII